jgi:hypothetical protein
MGLIKYEQSGLKHRVRGFLSNLRAKSPKSFGGRRLDDFLSNFSEVSVRRLDSPRHRLLGGDKHQRREQFFRFWSG